MDKNQVLETIKLARENSKKRKFDQSFDLIVNLTHIDLKKPEHNVDSFVVLPHGKGKPAKICALVGKQLAAQANIFDKVIRAEEFDKYQGNKPAIKKLAEEYDLFIAQANLMGKIATIFGRILGPRGKMPNPKSGCIIPPGADLNAMKSRLTNLIRVRTNKEPIVKSTFGKESMNDENLAENFMALYNSFVHNLPQEEKNVKDVKIKLTMGNAFAVGGKKELKQKLKETVKVEE